MRAPSGDLHAEVRRLVLSIRSFHAGLLSETDRHRHTLRALGPLIDMLRHPSRPTADKLAAAESCSRQLAKLRSLRQPWRETFNDLHRSVGEVRRFLRAIVKESSRAHDGRNAGDGDPHDTPRPESKSRRDSTQTDLSVRVMMRGMRR
jgi:hypothetical protein